MLCRTKQPASNTVVATSKSHELQYTAATQSIFTWHLINLISLDAVAIGLTWQLIFTLQFLDRFPSPVESSIIGSAIWLAYTADRSLDARRLRFDLPHSSRHAFHHKFLKLIFFIWIVILCSCLTLVVKFTSAAQVKWGLICLPLVLVYLLNAQKNSRPVRLFPKELQAGLIFAFGISLACWQAAPPNFNYSLLTATLVTGTLFSINCATIAYWERQLDTAQTFVAWTSQKNTTLAPIALALALQFLLIFVMFVFGMLPAFTTNCLLSSAACLAVVIFSNQQHTQCSGELGNHELPLIRNLKFREFLADIAFILPPAIPIAWHIFHS